MGKKIKARRTKFRLPILGKKSTHPLSLLSQDRAGAIDEVVARTSETVADSELERTITDSIFWERKRLEGKSDPIRDALDTAFWRDLGQQSLALSKIETDPSEALETRRFLLKKIIRYHAEEIAGNFDDNVYNTATLAVPRGLSWLLQTMSWKSIRNLFINGLDLRRQIHIQGKTDQIRKLSEKGTVMLVPTHFSNIDSMLVGWVLYAIGLPPFCYGAGLNLFTNPVFGFFMNNLGAYKVDRRKKHSLYKQTLKIYSSAILERGCHTLFFPGGGRSRYGGLEKKLKLGLLGTAIDAYIENLIHKRPKPNIYIVPCTISYHFTLEASTLIDDYLKEQGKNRYIIDDDESSHPKEVAQFLYKFLSASSSLYVNFGQAIDPFGNLVNDQGESLGVQEKPLDIKSFVISDGQICHQMQRDAQYTALLGEKILSRYRKENIALTSHFIAYAYFEFLRQKFDFGDIFRLFRLSEQETQVRFCEFAPFAMQLLQKLHSLYSSGEILLEPALRSTELRNILEAANRNLGVYHSKRPLKLSLNENNEIDEHTILSSEDTKLLFYYHNRMEGYHLCRNEK